MAVSVVPFENASPFSHEAYSRGMHVPIIRNLLEAEKLRRTPFYSLPFVFINE
jgi:hypothetical protein